MFFLLFIFYKFDEYSKIKLLKLLKYSYEIKFKYKLNGNKYEN